MGDKNIRASLKDRFISRYAYLLKRLEYLMGSRENAADALHETWLRLETMTDAGKVANTDAYLLGIANNVMVDQYRREQRHHHEEDIDELFFVADELADPERIVAARRNLEAMIGILDGLPARRRTILLAARVQGQLNQEIADDLGISLRLVEQELSKALKYCSERMESVTGSSAVMAQGRRKF
jgi:RNA polymerase sigma-70 factor (ECF subfamily)